MTQKFRNLNIEKNNSIGENIGIKNNNSTNLKNLTDSENIEQDYNNPESTDIPLISVTNVTKSVLSTQYSSEKNSEKEISILNNIDLEVLKGEVIFIMGCSGSGKSTLLRILGLIDHPSSGNVYFNNLRVDHLNEEELTVIRKKNIGFVSQFHHLLDGFTVRENLMLKLMVSGIYREREKKSKYIAKYQEIFSNKNHNNIEDSIDRELFEPTDALSTREISIIARLKIYLKLTFSNVCKLRLAKYIKNTLKGLCAHEQYMIHEYLDRLGMSRHLDTMVDRLSGGEKQRVAVARAVIGNPFLIIADEPTGSLDSANASDVSSFLIENAHEKKISVIIATHDQNLTKRGDKVFTLSEGKLYRDR